MRDWRLEIPVDNRERGEIEPACATIGIQMRPEYGREFHREMRGETTSVAHLVEFCGAPTMH